VAFGSDGEATKALAGFCKKNGVQVENVTREVDGKGVEYVWAVKHQPGLPANQVPLSEPPVLLLTALQLYSNAAQRLILRGA